MSEKNEVLEITAKVMVTEEDVDDIVTTALEGGICYWCNRAEVKGEYIGEFASEQIGKGGTLLLHVVEAFDDDETEWYELSKEKLLKGVKKYLEDESKPYNILCDSTDSVGSSKGYYVLDCSMVDAIIADMIVQYALFGEIVYG